MKESTITRTGEEKYIEWMVEEANPEYDSMYEYYDEPEDFKKEDILSLMEELEAKGWSEEAIYCYIEDYYGL